MTCTVNQQRKNQPAKVIQRHEEFGKFNVKLKLHTVGWWSGRVRQIKTNKWVEGGWSQKIMSNQSLCNRSRIRLREFVEKNETRVVMSVSAVKTQVTEEGVKISCDNVVASYDSGTFG